MDPFKDHHDKLFDRQEIDSKFDLTLITMLLHLYNVFFSTNTTFNIYYTTYTLSAPKITPKHARTRDKNMQ